MTFELREQFGEFVGQEGTKSQLRDAGNCGSYQMQLLRCKSYQRGFSIPWPVGRDGLVKNRLGQVHLAGLDHK
jgi:hypothetical protein